MKNNSDSRVIRRRKGVIYIIKMAVTKSQFSSVVSFVFISGADLGGGCRECAPPPPPEMTCGFLIQLVSCKKKKTMWFIGVEVE